VQKLYKAVDNRMARSAVVCLVAKISPSILVVKNSVFCVVLRYDIVAYGRIMPL
jgi:hypothetical protein